MLRCALLGTGRQANRLVDAIEAAGSKVMALYSRNIKDGERFAKDKNLSADLIISDDLDSILAHKDCDAAVISTPDFLHYEHARMALKSGKHVFLEKPLATNYDHGRELLALAEENKLLLAIDYHLRWSFALQYIQRLCEEGYFGSIQKVQLKWGWSPIK